MCLTVYNRRLKLVKFKSRITQIICQRKELWDSCSEYLIHICMRPNIGIFSWIRLNVWSIKEINNELFTQNCCWLLLKIDFFGTFQGSSAAVDRWNEQIYRIRFKFSLDLSVMSLNRPFCLSVLWHCWLGYVAFKNWTQNYLSCLTAWDVKPYLTKPSGVKFSEAAVYQKLLKLADTWPSCSNKQKGTFFRSQCVKSIEDV